MSLARRYEGLHVRSSRKVAVRLRLAGTGISGHGLSQLVDFILAGGVRLPSFGHSRPRSLPLIASRPLKTVAKTCKTSRRKSLLRASPPPRGTSARLLPAREVQWRELGGEGQRGLERLEFA